MNAELLLLNKQLEQKKKAKQQVDIWETNIQLKHNIKKVRDELQSINEQLSTVLKETSKELSESLSFLNEYKKAIDHNIIKTIEQQHTADRYLTDRLTKLPNRMKLIENIENGQYTAITTLNIDAFQEINDLYGQSMGDAFLKSFGQYLSSQLDEHSYCLYKLPVDEFVIASKSALNPKTFKNVIHDLIKNLDEHLFFIEGNEIHVNVTGGMSYGSDTTILGNANIALKRSKIQKLPFMVFDETMQNKELYANNQTILKTLKDAIVNDRVIPYFQPIISNTTMKIEKYETLIRIVDNKGNVISPCIFLDIAKRSRIYRKLIKIIIDKSFTLFKDKDIPFTINLSIDDIIDPSMRKYIFHKLENFTQTKNVIFEITESEEINNYSVIKDFIKEVKTYDVQIAIDDFGSGYSNFMHLLELNVDFIKIDGSIIKNIIVDKNSQALTKAIFNVAQELHIEVIAEYVNTEKILNAVKDIGIDHSQGFYLGEPLPHIIE